jgi:hypothetical protein
MPEYEAEHGPFAQERLAEAGAWTDRIFGPAVDDRDGLREGGPLDGSDV